MIADNGFRCLESTDGDPGPFGKCMHLHCRQAWEREQAGVIHHVDAAGTETVMTLQSAVAASWDQEARDAMRRAELEEEAARRVRKRRRRKVVKQRQGKGHDPRRQVIARVRVSGRGRGKR